MSNPDWKVFLNYKQLSEGYHYKWVKDGTIAMSFGLGPMATIQVKGPNLFNKEIATGRRDAGSYINIGADQPVNVPPPVKKNPVPRPRRVYAYKKPAKKVQPIKVEKIEKPITMNMPQQTIVKLSELEREQADVYLDYTRLGTEQYEWLDAGCIRINVRSYSNCSVLIISPKDSRTLYFDVGKRNPGFTVVLRKNN